MVYARWTEWIVICGLMKTVNSMGWARRKRGAKLESLLYRYTPLMKKTEAIEAVSDLKPIGPEHLWIKKFAVLSLMLDAAARGDRPENAVLAKSWSRAGSRRSENCQP